MIKRKRSGGNNPEAAALRAIGKRQGSGSRQPAGSELSFGGGNSLSFDRLARDLYSERRERRRYFGDTLFGEAAWDMLLLLYWADAHGRGLNASILKRAVGAPLSAAQRWLRLLESQGLVAFRQGPGSHLSPDVELTDTARTSLNDYLEQLAATRR